MHRVVQDDEVWAALCRRDLSSFLSSLRRHFIETTGYRELYRRFTDTSFVQPTLFPLAVPSILVPLDIKRLLLVLEVKCDDKVIHWMRFSGRDLLPLLNGSRSFASEEQDFALIPHTTWKPTKEELRSYNRGQRLTGTLPESCTGFDPSNFQVKVVLFRFQDRHTMDINAIFDSNDCVLNYRHGQSRSRSRDRNSPPRICLSFTPKTDIEAWPLKPESIMAAEIARKFSRPVPLGIELSFGFNNDGHIVLNRYRLSSNSLDEKGTIKSFEGGQNGATCKLFANSKDHELVELHFSSSHKGVHVLYASRRTLFVGVQVW